MLKLLGIVLLAAATASLANEEISSGGPISIDGKVTAITQHQIVIQTSKKLYVLNREMVTPKLDPQIVLRPTHFIVRVMPEGIDAVKAVEPNRGLASQPRIKTVE